LAALAVGLTSPTIRAASAANSPTFRDRSLFTAGFDPDFVKLSGMTVTPERP
jgi:hypothetical protein